MNRQRRDPLRKLHEEHARRDQRRDSETAPAEVVSLDPQVAVDMDLAADSDVSVLLTAENQAQRAAWARTIHDRSARCQRPFVPVSAPAIPDANSVVVAGDVKKWFECAAGGTLFIDQVWALTEDLQGQLLSFLTEQSLARTRTTPPQGRRDVRIIAGSDRSLLTYLADGGFSAELFYRLNVIHIDFTASSSRRASLKPLPAQR
jgi:DNA-binding NtrC family response regulator